MSGNNERIRDVLAECYSGHAYRVLKGLEMIRAGDTDTVIVDFFRRFEGFSERKTRLQIRKLRSFERARLV